MTDTSHQLLQDATALQDHIVRVLHRESRTQHLFPRGVSGAVTSSAVLFLLSPGCGEGGAVMEPCVVLNKRSVWVKQAGDLCFPGGSIASRLDPWIARCLRLPYSPLTRWPFWRWLCRRRPSQARRLAILLATGLRESVEEMRVNPFGLKFLGPMPGERVVMFHRVIYPMVTWIRRQRRFSPNWEVERVVYIPIKDLLDPSHYARYRPWVQDGSTGAHPMEGEDFPCFLHHHSEGREVLWGATHRMIMAFLEVVFDFREPSLVNLPIVERKLEEDYFKGS